MTVRLYYRDSFLREFDAAVTRCSAAGSLWHVVLDRTAFYPTSGGQPHDTGALGGANVLEVLSAETDAVVHVVDRQLMTGPVRGMIDWDRRFDHMQQHTGQHLLSAVFATLFEFPTVSFHLGAEGSTIDLAAPSVTAEQMEQVEARANALIFEDRPIRVGFGTAEQLAEAGVRKEVQREGVLRAIEIEGVERQPCGGTHVARTGQIGLLLLRKCERMKQNWRVEFVCGGRALRAARSDFERLTDAAKQLGCAPADVPAMIGRALEERQDSYRARQRLQEQLAEAEALVLLATEARPTGAAGSRVVLHVFEDADADFLRMLAAKLVTEPCIQVLLGSHRGGHLVFAQSAGLAADMNGLLREIVQAAGGKGGGTKHFAQGRIPSGVFLDQVLQQAVARLRG